MGTYKPVLIGRWFYLLTFGLFGVAAVFLVGQMVVARGFCPT